MEMRDQGWNVRTCELGGEDASGIRELTMNSKYVLYTNGIAIALLREDGDELGAVMCGGLNVGADEVARAVKAALVEHCLLVEVDDESGDHTCNRTHFICESVTSGKPVDALQCPLVRRVLDALGLGEKAVK
jgi:hypothetical protein